MNKIVTTPYDVADHLRTAEEIAAYLEAIFAEADGDATFSAAALGDISRAKGMAQVARDTGVSRESLYKALSGARTPSFDPSKDGHLPRAEAPRRGVWLIREPTSRRNGRVATTPG
jgi:probable addiction module antidote protein